MGRVFSIVQPGTCRLKLYAWISEFLFSLESKRKEDNLGVTHDVQRNTTPNISAFIQGTFFNAWKLCPSYNKLENQAVSIASLSLSVTMQTQSWMMILAAVCAALVHFCSSAVESHSAQADQISSLPGQPRVSFQQFSGYITIDEKQDRSFFYYFVEAENDTTALKPLVVWFSGGKIYALN